jgi:hypothetical protein
LRVCRCRHYRSFEMGSSSTWSGLNLKLVEIGLIGVSGNPLIFPPSLYLSGGPDLVLPLTR